MKNKKQLILRVVIEGNSANDLRAIGAEELASYFFPVQLAIAKKDIVSCHLYEPTEMKYDEEGKPIDFGQTHYGKYIKEGS